MRWSRGLLIDRKSWGARGGLATDGTAEAGGEKESRAQRLLRAKLGLVSESLEERHFADSQSRRQRGSKVTEREQSGKKKRLDQGSEGEPVLAGAGWALPHTGQSWGLQGHSQELEEGVADLLLQPVCQGHHKSSSCCVSGQLQSQRRGGALRPLGGVEVRRTAPETKGRGFMWANLDLL